MATVAELLSPKTALAYLQSFFLNAAARALDVTTWRTGDPTNVLAEFESESLGEVLDPTVVSYAKSAFIADAEEEWAELHASEVYGIDRGEETFSTPTITLINGGGGQYPVGPGEVTAKCTATGATFHSTAILSGSDPLMPGATVVLQLEADVGGSAGTVGNDDIDQLVTTMLGVTIDESTPGVGNDKQSITSLKQDCYDSRGALSPNGPADAFEYVVRRPALTGLAAGAITRSRSTNDSSTGTVTVYVCDAAGDSDGPRVAAAQAAIVKWAMPLTVTPTTLAATKVVTSVTYTVSGDDIPIGFQALISAELAAMFSEAPIANEDGATLYRDAIRARIRKALALNDLGNVVLSAPAADVAYTTGQVPALGTVTGSEV